MQNIAPVRQMERENLMDILRGFAILGIFIANLNFFPCMMMKKFP